MSPTKIIVLGIVLIIIVGALLWYFVVPSYFQNSNPQLGTEIKNYPLGGLSFTVTNWTFATFDEIPNVIGITGFLQLPQSGSIYVLVNFTLRNISDMEINFVNVQAGTADASPLLQYGNYYAQATPNSFSVLPVYNDQSTDLLPTQTTHGVLVYEILEGYTPSSLLYPNQNSPTFVINLSG